MTRMSASEAFVETLVAQGVTDVFGIVGSAFMDALDIFEPAGIRYISVVHEQGAAHMADGFARAGNRHGVCIAQNGPGVTNLVTGIAAAYWAHSPVVAITPETGSNSMGLGGFQETEQIPLFSKITKYQANVTDPARIAELTSRAFDLAMAERGPVQINIPRNHFYGEIDADIAKPRKIKRGPGAPECLAKAAETLAEAEFPVIISGGGVVAADGVDEVRALAEYLSAPVVTSFLHNDAFPASHELMCGPLGYQGSKAAMRVIGRADVVLALGSRLGPLGTFRQYEIDYWPESAKIIQVDSDHRVFGLVKEATVAITGDAKAAAANILDRLKVFNVEIAAHKNKGARLAEVRKQKDAWEAELDSLSSADGTPIAPRRALRELEKAMPGDAIVATDIGNVCSTANSYLKFDRPSSFLAAMSFANCGFALPAAIGAKVAVPDRPVVAYAGDGAWAMSCMETLTCVREKIPVTAVVLNNRQWGAEKSNQINYYANRYVGTNLENPNYAKLAGALGARGISIESADQISDALAEATASDTMTVIDIPITQDLAEPFRRDALKKPVRLLGKYRDYTVA